MKAYFASGGRYPVLRALAILYLIGSVVSIVAGVAAIVWSLGWGPGDFSDRLLIALGALAATFFICVSMLAIAEVLKLFIDIEHNSRIAALGLAHTATAGAMATTPADAQPVGSSRLSIIDDETAEAALLRGH
jgi:hypothetical protein